MLASCCKPAVEELIVEVVRKAHSDGALSKAIPAKDLGRLTLAIMQGEEFLQKEQNAAC
jgi:hypothetical protein